MRKARRSRAAWGTARVLYAVFLSAGWLAFRLIPTPPLLAFLWGCATGLWVLLGWTILRLLRCSHLLMQLAPCPDPEEEDLRRFGQLRARRSAWAGAALWLKLAGGMALAQGVLATGDAGVLLVALAVACQAAFVWESLGVYRELHRLACVQYALLRRARELCRSS